MGLLDYLTTHAMDEDYEFVSERRQQRLAEGAEGERAPSHSRIGVAGALVMALFAALVVTAAVQTSRNSVSNEKERRELVSQVDQARAQGGHACRRPRCVPPSPAARRARPGRLNGRP